MAKECDHLSVGTIIEDGINIALLLRAKLPQAYAPPAGHIDQHGSPEQAAINEPFEELGLIIAPEALIKTAIANRRVDNPCPRGGGNYHHWWVFRATQFEGRITPSADETRGAAWYDREQLQALADRTIQWRADGSNSEDWQQNPGLEEVWLGFLAELGYISIK